jgi:tetratricopeptide (TPR) repeat protein
MVSTLPRPRSASSTADFTTPLTLPGGTVSGAELVRELPADVALPVWHTLRSVLLWTQVPPGARAALFGDGAMEAWEAEVLTGALEEAVRNPLAVIARELSAPEVASPQQIAWACFCVTEWALGRRSTATAIIFAEAAALAWPEHPRYAWAAGRLMRTHGKLRDAEIWMRRAIRVAIGCSDRETQVLGLNSLGNVLREQGNYRQAEPPLREALHLAQRYRLRKLESELHHDLYVLAAEQNHCVEAERHAKRALDLYGELQHPRLPFLAHDIAYMWMSRGDFAQALTIFLPLAQLVTAPIDRIRLLASTARAAAACNDETMYDRAAAEAKQLIGEFQSVDGIPTAYLLLAQGAATFEKWASAKELARQSSALARDRGEAVVILHADQFLDRLTSGQAPQECRAASDCRGMHPLAREFAARLEDSSWMVETSAGLSSHL